MDLKTDKLKAQKEIKEITDKAKELYDISAFELQNAKIKANDWYQQVIQVVENTFYEPQKLIDNMNNILITEGRPTRGADIKKAFSIHTIDFEREKEILLNKVKKIVAFLTDIVNDSN